MIKFTIYDLRLTRARFQGARTLVRSNPRVPSTLKFISTALGTLLISLCNSAIGQSEFNSTPKPPYPQSTFFSSITWHWETYTNAAIGSDLWPVTWGADDNLYSAWGDGGGFGGSDSLGRVAAGFARIEGGPETFRGFNVNGGVEPEHRAFLPKKGKVSGIIAVNGILYANINLQDGTWPDVHHQLAWSTNRAATWTRADWTFDRGLGAFQPTKFISFGKDDSEVPKHHAGFVYIYCFKQPQTREEVRDVYLVRVPKGKILERSSYEFFTGLDNANHPLWNSDFSAAHPVFTDLNGTTSCTVVYSTSLKRYLATAFHIGPGQLGVFDASEPWGPWTTVAYYETWGGMGNHGEGLSCEFPQKWMSADGLTLWSIFSVYGEGGKIGIKAHDRFNLVKVTLQRQR